MAYLEIVDGSNQGESFELSGEETTIGRSLANAICLADNRASRNHARIIVRDDKYFVEDLNSSNGTYLQGEPIPSGTPIEIYDGDYIIICSTRLRFRSVCRSGDSSVVDEQSAYFGNMSVKMAADSARMNEPEVNMSLDASMVMQAVLPQDDDSDSGKGMINTVNRLQAMCEVSIALGAIMDQKELLQKIMECIFDIFPNADRAFIMLKCAESGELKPVAARKRDGTGSREKIEVSHTIINKVVDERISILSNDAMSDDRFSAQMSIVNLSIRSILCVPLLLKDELLGLMQIDSTSGVKNFDENDLQLLTGICSQIAIAVKNAQLYKNLENETAQRTSLQRYFSPNMVEMLMKGDVDTKLGGRKYEGTVFFSDIIGFTRMSENLSADQVVSNLNRYFNIMQKIIYDNGGNVDKFGGDAIMAFWGVPEHDDNDELNAVLTGIEMQSNLWSFNLALEREGMELIHMGIGINTGDFVAGNVGSEDKIEFTLIGDEVNLASRIESHAGRGQVFVAESTWLRIMHKASGVKLPLVKVKGKSKPVQIYSVRSILNSSSSYFSSAIYCEVLNASGNMLGKGVIVAVGDVDNDPYMVLNCNCALEVNQQLGLRMSISELGTPMGMVAHVKSAGNMILSGHKVGYSRVVLNRLSEGGGLEIFRPGNWIESKLSWDMLKRV